jgi:hypothetical protein
MTIVVLCRCLGNEGFESFVVFFFQTCDLKLKVYKGIMGLYGVSAGQRARVPPDPIPNSAVKLCSVPNCSAVLGHANLGKLATFLKLKAFQA